MPTKHEDGRTTFKRPDGKPSKVTPCKPVAPLNVKLQAGVTLLPFPGREGDGGLKVGAISLPGPGDQPVQSAEDEAFDREIAALLDTPGRSPTTMGGQDNAAPATSDVKAPVSDVVLEVLGIIYEAIGDISDGTFQPDGVVIAFTCPAPFENGAAYFPYYSIGVNRLELIGLLEQVKASEI
jgi:hypothetical protein